MTVNTAIEELTLALDKAELRLSLAEAVQVLLQELEGAPSRVVYEQIRAAKENLAEQNTHLARERDQCMQRLNIREQQLGAIALLLRVQ